MKVMRPTYYTDNLNKVKIGGFKLNHDLVNRGVLNSTVGNTLEVNKKADSFGTFDDGLLFQFPLKKYKHLTYYCRTATENLDTCNVKLFKLQEFISAADEKKNAEWQPPLTRN